MKILEYCMFHNEYAVLEIKRGEASRWIDELHICESSKTFRGADRRSVLPAGDGFLIPHLFDGTRFHPPRQWGPSRHWPFFRNKDMARKNETMQRNYVREIIDPEDQDIVILSDIDEIIDSRYADQIIFSTKKHGIISVELHHTFFYLNLYSTNFHEVWKNSPPNYAYRVFVMTGQIFKSMRRSSDRLRRLGEWNRLGNEVHLVKGFSGFHHSWLGDEDVALDKIQSYSHSLGEHSPELAGADGAVSRDGLRALMQSGRSLFEGNNLVTKDFDEIPPLLTVAENAENYRKLILAV